MEDGSKYDDIQETNNVKIHRLRVIHLYEADLSLLWGVKWREGMHKALKTKALHQGQYRGLPGRDCTSLTYLEELRVDYSKLTRYPVANFDNDATSCYDRILCAVASLAGRNLHSCTNIGRSGIQVKIINKSIRNILQALY
jgi:hypothetical protein